MTNQGYQLGQELEIGGERFVVAEIRVSDGLPMYRVERIGERDGSGDPAEAEVQATADDQADAVEEQRQRGDLDPVCDDRLAPGGDPQEAAEERPPVPVISYRPRGDFADDGWRQASTASGYNSPEVRAGRCARSWCDVEIRDSAHPAGDVLHFSRAEWQAFCAGARLGEFELT